MCGVPEERCVVHPLWHEMVLVLELSLEGVESMLLGECEVAEVTWEWLVVGVGDVFVFWEGADGGHGRWS
jgi:hypothetical protein